jgi:hypothetical protein
MRTDPARHVLMASYACSQSFILIPSETALKRVGPVEGPTISEQYNAVSTCLAGRLLSTESGTGTAA